MTLSWMRINLDFIRYNQEWIFHSLSCQGMIQEAVDQHYNELIVQ